MIKDFYFIFLVYSQTWLNLLPSDDCHFGFFFNAKRKRKKKKNNGTTTNF